MRKVLDLVDGQECIIVGTLYKEMKLKPSILDEYGRDLSLPRAVASSAKFVSDDDALVLEDEAARVKLRGEGLRVGDLVSGTEMLNACAAFTRMPALSHALFLLALLLPPAGVVLALRGAADGADFDVTDVCFVPLGPQAPLPGVPSAAAPAFATPADAAAAQPPPDADAKYVALVSGLQLGAPGVDPLPAALLADWLGGHLGGRGETALAARVVRLIIAGDTLCALPPAPGHVDAKAASRLAAPLREADLLLTQLASALPVDLMPGRNDPSNAALPQQPLHACLLPHAARYSATMQRVTNPHECSLDGVRLLGTSGQNVDDLYRCTDSEARLGLLASTLAWGHLAPSAPDTLACYPFHDRDPFLVGGTPHILFAGNQPEYATALLRGAVRAGDAGGSGDATAAHEGVTRIVLVPSFASSGTVVLVNLSTLACHPVTFSTAPLAADGGGA